MPNRIVREGLIDSEPFNALSWQAQTLFVRIMLKADDFGRYTSEPKLLRPHLFPLLLNNVQESDIQIWLDECESMGLLQQYSVDGKRYVSIPKFGQRTRADKSKFPAPPTCVRQMSDKRQTSAHVVVVGGVVGDVSVVEGGVGAVVESAVGSTADSKQGRQMSVNEQRWADVDEALKKILSDSDREIVLRHFKHQHPSCPEVAERSVVGWAIEAKWNCKDEAKAKYVLGCGNPPSDKALAEYKRIMNEVRGAA